MEIMAESGILCIGLDELNPQSYWGFADLATKAGTKLHNSFYVQADVKKENNIEFYRYQKILKFSPHIFQKLFSK